MRQPSASLAYRQASTQQASPIGLVILLYDTLIGDLKRSIAAMHAGDIEARCRHMKHGFLVLQQLDGLLDMARGGITAKNLRRFYGHLRGQMLRAQFDLSPQLLERQIALILEVRGAWQQIDTPTAPSEVPSAEVPSASRSGGHRSFTCTA